VAGQADGPADVHSRRDHRVPARTQLRAVVAVSESEPWGQCGTRRKSTERPKSTRRYATAPFSPYVATGAMSLERSRDAGAAVAVPIVCRSGAGRRRRVSVGRGNVRCREIGHGNIDANDPYRKSPARGPTRSGRRDCRGRLWRL